VGDPLKEQAETLAALRQVVDAAGPYLDHLPERLVYDRAAEPLLGELGGPLPERGAGTKAAVEQLLRVGTATATASAGPRFYHFVIGGSTPAALAADWVVSLLDQNAFVRASSRFSDAVETVTLSWLRELFGLPAGWGGVLTASATFANLSGTLAAYGRTGYRELVERHGDLAAHLAAAVDAAGDLERLAEVPLNVVCFRYRPAGLDEPALDDVNRRLGEALLDDGRVFAGTTVYGGRVALRPAISNWRTTAADLDLLVDVARELGGRTARAG
jgi:glutamate/tyrosine decarboxylase-like PLP-dependent enzyme